MQPFQSVQPATLAMCLVSTMQEAGIELPRLTVLALQLLLIWWIGVLVWVKFFREQIGSKLQRLLNNMLACNTSCIASHKIYRLLMLRMVFWFVRLSNCVHILADITENTIEEKNDIVKVFRVFYNPSCLRISILQCSESPKNANVLHVSESAILNFVSDIFS